MSKNKDIEFIKSIFEKYGVNNILNINGKYYDTLVKRIIYEYRVFDKWSFSTSRFSNISNFIVKTLIILGGACLSIIKSKKYKQNGNPIEDNIIAIPFADRIIRFKMLSKISEEDIGIIYPPVFHFTFIKDHLDYFITNRMNVHLGCFSFRSILYSLFIVLNNFHKLNNCSKELDQYFQSRTCKLPGIILLTILYHDFFERLIRKIPPTTSKIWIFDYDFDLKYIVFNSIIHRQRKEDKTIHLQHGSFFNYHEAYCNPISDYSLCCSKREQEIINKYNPYQSTIIPLGAPLQTFLDSIPINDPILSPTYDIVVLLGSTYEKKREQQQKTIIKLLNKNNYKVLYRFRPASRKIDELKLKSDIANSDISNGTTLQTDISRAKIIISFSEDAIYCAMRNQKKIVLFIDENPTSIYNYNCTTNNIYISNETGSEVLEIIDDMVRTYDECNYYNDNFVIFNFGDNDLTLLRGKFNCLIKKLI